MIVNKTSSLSNRYVPMPFLNAQLLRTSLVTIFLLLAISPSAYSAEQKINIDTPQSDINPAIRDDADSNIDIALEEKIEGSAPAQHSWLFLHPYSAKYTVLSDGDSLGHATRQLKKTGPDWSLNTYAKISKYMLTLKSTELTEFHLKESQLVTDRFYSSTKMTFKKARKMEQKFDWQKNLETGSRGKKQWQIEIKPQVYDRVSHIIQMRSDFLAGKRSFRYLVSYKGIISEYLYEIDKKEILTTSMGKLSTVKLIRNKSGGDIFALWLSPELNYFPVKIAQYEQDKPDVTLLLESLDYKKEPVAKIE